MSNYLKQIYRKIVPQSEPIPGRELEMTMKPGRLGCSVASPFFLQPPLRDNAL